MGTVNEREVIAVLRDGPSVETFAQRGLLFLKEIKCRSAWLDLITILEKYLIGLESDGEQTPLLSCLEINTCLSHSVEVEVLPSSSDDLKIVTLGSD